jgi:hypothetical protein
MLQRAVLGGLAGGLIGTSVMTVAEKLEQLVTKRPNSYVPAQTLAALLFTPVRLTVDQTLENATGVGRPPWTWPREELVIDVAHKAVYAPATGAAVDRLTRRADIG